MKETAIRVASVAGAGEYAARANFVNTKALVVNFHVLVHRFKGMWLLRNSKLFAHASVGEGAIASSGRVRSTSGPRDCG